MLLHATNYGTSCSLQWAYATSYRAASAVLPELDGFNVARVVSWVFMHGQHNGQVRHPSFGQLHACPWGLGQVVKEVPTPCGRPGGQGPVLALSHPVRKSAKRIVARDETAAAVLRVCVGASKVQQPVRRNAG